MMNSLRILVFHGALLAVGCSASGPGASSGIGASALTATSSTDMFATLVKPLEQLEPNARAELVAAAAPTSMREFVQRLKALSESPAPAFSIDGLRFDPSLEAESDFAALDQLAATYPTYGAYWLAHGNPLAITSEDFVRGIHAAYANRTSPNTLGLVGDAHEVVTNVLGPSFGAARRVMDTCGALLGTWVFVDRVKGAADNKKQSSKPSDEISQLKSNLIRQQAISDSLQAQVFNQQNQILDLSRRLGACEG